MKNILEKIKLEIQWWIFVFGISEWKIFRPENIKTIKKDLKTFFNCILISIPLTCFISFCIDTIFKNYNGAIFWWTVGLFSLLVLSIFGKIPVLDDKKDEQ